MLVRKMGTQKLLLLETPCLIWSNLKIHFSKLSVRGLTLICEGCPNLKYLDLSGCMNLTGRDIAKASLGVKGLEIKKPNFYIPRSVFNMERYGHWSLYDERFQTDVFRI